jgi:biopolymer transport protein ExbD
MKAKIKKNAVKSEINIAPFTDVILVLLIIFMIAMPQMQHEIQVNLPKTNSSDKMSSPGSNIEVLISQKGIAIDGKVVILEDVEGVIKIKLKENPGTAVVIKGDVQVEYDRVMQFMDRAKKAGTTKFALAVDLKQ